jgi:MoxR-like ATPase
MICATGAETDGYAVIAEREAAIAGMLQDHALGKDLLLVGGRGEGKSALGMLCAPRGAGGMDSRASLLSWAARQEAIHMYLRGRRGGVYEVHCSYSPPLHLLWWAVRQFAHRLGYRTETIHMYRDMTARDLLQRRTTTDAGDTKWELTPLVTYAPSPGGGGEGGVRASLCPCPLGVFGNFMKGNICWAVFVARGSI